MNDYFVHDNDYENNPDYKYVCWWLTKDGAEHYNSNVLFIGKGYGSPVSVGDFTYADHNAQIYVDPVCGEIRQYFPDDSYIIVAKTGI